MKKSEKLQIFSIWDLNGDVATVIAKLTDSLTTFSKTHTNVKLRIESESSYYESVETSIEIWGDREETEAEKDKRLQDAAQTKERQEEWERAQFKQLQAKYGDKP